jgi:hypothetical protein
MQAKFQVNGGLLLYVVVSKGTTILKLLVNGQWTHPEGKGLAVSRDIILPSKGALIRALVTIRVKMGRDRSINICPILCGVAAWLLTAETPKNTLKKDEPAMPHSIYQLCLVAFI